jgi:hypothetical protein
LRGDAALARAVVTADGYTGPPCPGDLVARPELRGLPNIPEANIVAQYTFVDGPFGDVNHVMFFEDGKVVRDQWGIVDNPDVWVRVPYEAIAYVRAGERTILDALEHGTIGGEIGPMAMLAGILEAPEFEAAERATSRHSFALAALGHLDAEPAYAAAMEELAKQTDPA